MEINEMEISEQEKLARAAFLSLAGVGSQRLRRLITEFGSAQQAWEAPQSKYTQLSEQYSWLAETGKARSKIDPAKIGCYLSDLGIQTITPEETDYPALLAELDDAPPLLFYRGILKNRAEVLAVVGSRQATPYGKAAAKSLAKAAAAEGIVIVSGLARGIDTAAHQGALESGGTTWAFMGCGLDRVYPAENKKLAEQIQRQGALLSEYLPGTPPVAKNFPIRNRLISGCSLGVLVVEAAERSGAMITVDFALEQGREVFAVPGSVFSRQSRGTHNLLRQGAKIVEGIEDIWQELPALSRRKSTCIPRTAAEGSLSSAHLSAVPSCGSGNPDHDLVLEQLSDMPLHIDQMIVHSALSVSRLSLALRELQLAGKILQLPGQCYVLARKS